MSDVIEKLKEKFKEGALRSIEKEIEMRARPILEVMKEVLNEQRRTNELLEKILEVLKDAKGRKER